MKSSKGLIYFILLNLLISVCATLSVLVVWDRINGPVTGGVLPVVLALLRPQASTPTPEARSGTPTPEPTPTRIVVVYQVKEGDTFGSIGERYGVKPEELMAFNGFTSPTVLGVGEVLQIPVATSTPAPIPVVIDSVIGVGDLASEQVTIKHPGEGEVSLAGWTLENENGNKFTFPALTLYKDGAVNLLSREGNNTVVELYWGLGQPVYQSGETLTLKDGQGKTVNQYAIP